MAKRRLKVWSTLGWGTFWLTLLVVLVPLMVTAVARSPFARAYAKNEASRAIARELGLVAYIRDVDLDPGRLSLVARGISIDHPEHGRLVDAVSLRIRPSWWALATGGVDLNIISIEQATVHLKIRDGVIVNFPDVPVSSEGSDEVELPLSFLDIRDSRVVVDADPIATGELSHIDILLDATDGDRAEVHIKASGGHVKHRTGTDHLQRLDVQLALTPDHLEVERIEVSTPEVSVKLSDTEVGFPVRESAYRGRLGVSVDLAQLMKWPHGVELPPLTGRVSLDAAIEGKAMEVAGTGEVELSKIVIDGYGVTEYGKLEVTGDKHAISWNGNVAAIEDGGTVDIEGSVELTEGLPLRAKGYVHEVQFSKLMKQLDVSPDAIVEWILNGRFELSGTLSPLALGGPLHFDNTDFEVTQDAWHVRPKRHVLSIPDAKLDGHVRITEQAFILERILATMPSTSLNVDQVWIGYDNSARVRAQTIAHDMADTTPLVGFEMAGNGGFEVEIGGTYSEPIVSGKLAYKQFEFATFPFGDIDADFKLEKDSMAVRFTDVHGRKNESRYSTDSLLMDFSDDRLFIGGDLEIGKMTLADFYHVFHYQDDERWLPYQGNVSGQARMTYTQDFPEDGDNGTMHTDISLDIPEADLNGYAFTDGRFEGSWHWFDHEVGYEAGEMNIDRFSLHKGKGTVSVSGKMLQGGELDMVVIGDRVAVRDTEGLRESMPGLGGTYGVTGSIKGVVSKPRVNMDLVGSGLHFRGKALGASRGYARLTDKSDPWIAEALSWTKGKPPADATCGHGREGLARGVWPADPPLKTIDGPQPVLDQPMAWVVCGQLMGGELTADVAVGQTDVLPLRGRYNFDKFIFGRFLPQNPHRAPLRGHLSGHVSLTEGALKRPRSLGGEVHLTELRAGQLDVELQNSGPVIVRIERGELEVESASFIGPDSQLYISGGGSHRRGLDLTFDGSIDLGLASSLSQTVTSAMGRVDLRFKVSGPMAKPAVHGYANVRGGALRIASFPTPMSNVNGNVTFTDQRVLLEDFRAQVAGGELAWRGSATLKGRTIGSYLLEIDGRSLKVSPREDIDLVVGADAELSWKKGERLPRLTGLLRVEQLRYARDVQVGRSLGDMVRKERAVVQIYDPEKDLLALNLRVTESQPLHIDNNLMDARLTLDKDEQGFRIVGTDQRYGVLGSMAVKRGTLRYRGTTFDIRHGEFHFEDETRIAPAFDIRATTVVQRSQGLAQADWNIQLHAYGSRDEFQFDLSSDPYLAKDDIALLLTMGMTHAELAQMETGDLTGTAALEALATVTGVEREVQRAVPTIDEVGVQSAYSARSSRSEPQVYIGKKVAERVRLSAATGVGESRDFTTGVELQVSDQTSVEAKYNNQNTSGSSNLGDVGVDLKWRLEFD